MAKRHFQLIFVATAIVAGSASAQESIQAAPAAQELQESLSLQQASPPQDRAITPKRSDKTPPGIAARKTSGSVDWAEVRRLVEVTRQRDQQRPSTARELLSAPSRIETQRVLQPGVRPVQREQLQSFKSLNEKQVARTTVPVLVPITNRTADSTRIYGRKNAYTAIIDANDGVRIELIGTPMRVTTQSTAATRQRFSERRKQRKRLDALDANYVISQHEQGIDLSFSKFNVAYMISVYCDKPDTDQRCTGEDYIISLASSVALLNPQVGGIQ